MARKSDEDIFELIHSLSKKEKIIFKVFANSYSSGKKKYLRLYDFIEQQKQYDENILKKKLIKEKILTPLAILKKYLFELIFKSLRLQYSSKSIDGQLRDLFTDIEICQAKGLKKLRNKTLKRAKSIANSNSKNIAALNILDKEWVLLAEGEPLDLFKEYENIIKTLKLSWEYRSLIHRMRNLLRKGGIREESSRNEWELVIQDPLMNINQYPERYEEKFIYHSIWMTYYAMTNHLEYSINHQELLVKTFESNKDFLLENKGRYMSTLQNLIALRCENKEIEKAKIVMGKLTEIENWELSLIEKKSLINHATLGYSNLIHGNILTQNFDEGFRVAEEIEVFVKTKAFDPISYNKAALFYNLSDFYLRVGEHKKALFYNNILLNGLLNYYREDAQYTSRILNLIIHYELGHDELLPSLVRSAYHFLHQRKRLYKMEDAILRFIRSKLPKANSPKELIEFFKELKSELEEITQDAYEAKALGYFDFITWLESKIQNRSFVDIAREKALQKNS